MTNVQKQCLLVYLGYDTGGIGNGWGPKSEEAARKFQEDNGLEPDGIFGPLTEAKALEAAFGSEPQKEPSAPAPAPVEPVPAVDMDENTVMVFSMAQDGGKYLAKNFQVREFACHDGTDPVFVHSQLPRWCQAVRDTFCYSFTPGSAYRTVEHNAKPSVGGAKLSLHTRGLAVDIPANGDTTPEMLYDFFQDLLGDTGGLILYSWGVHVDVRKNKYRSRG